MEYFQMKARVGGFLAVALVLIITAAVTVGELGSWFTPKHTYTVFLRNASLLPQGARVSYAGFPVGHVQAITIRPAEERAHAHSSYPVALTLTVYATTPVRQDSRVEMLTDGVIGDRYIDIHPGTGAPLPPGSTILGTTGGLEGLMASFASGGGLHEFITATTSLLTDTSQPHSLPTTLANVNLLLRDLQTRFTALVSTGTLLLEETQKEMEQVGEKADQVLTHADATIRENRTGLRQLVVELNRALVDVQRTMTTAHTFLGDSQEGLASVMQEIRQLLQNIQHDRATLAERAEKLLADMDALLAHNDRNVYAAIRDLRATMARLKDAAELVRANPAVLIWGNRQSGNTQTEHATDQGTLGLEGRGRIGRYGRIR